MRLCVVLAWTALELGCQQALQTPKIGQRFKDDLDTAISGAGLTPIDWSQGLWQSVRLLQELRKTYIHRVASLNDMFPQFTEADHAIDVVRAAIAAIFDHVSIARPAWVDLNESHGWDAATGARDTMHSMVTTGGASPEDESAIRIAYVEKGVEHVAGIHPPHFDYEKELQLLAGRVNVPIAAVRAYRGKDLIMECHVHMRGN